MPTQRRKRARRNAPRKKRTLTSAEAKALFDRDAAQFQVVHEAWLRTPDGNKARLELNLARRGADEMAALTRYRRSFSAFAAAYYRKAAKPNPGLTKRKAREMLRRGEFSSARQRRFLGARASGAPVKKAARRNPSRDSYGVYEIADRGRAIGFAAAESAAGARRFLEEMGGVRNVDRLQVRELVRGLTLNKALELARHLQRGGNHAR